MNDNLINKWTNSLTRTRKSTFGRISKIIGTSEIDDETWDDLEALFIQADMGIETTNNIINSLKHIVQSDGVTKANELREAIYSNLVSQLGETPELDLVNSPFVILIVGVNGSGKTTNMAKLGQMFKKEGKYQD